MRAMVLENDQKSLIQVDLPIPIPEEGYLLLKVHTCGLCHTDLHIMDGDLVPPRLPLVLGHQIVGHVEQTGPNVTRFRVGDRLGVPWLGAVDGTCPACRRGQENLCDHPVFTGYQVNGGFAEYTLADERFCFRIPEIFSDIEAAPLLCAGLIGYRSYRMMGDDIERLGIYGFGAAAHLVTQVANFHGKRVFAFTRPGDKAAQEFALRHGAFWAGDSTGKSPVSLDAALIFAPVGSLVIQALKAVRKGGRVVCGGIHMSDIPSFPYSLLWEERSIISVANLTRRDGEEFLSLASQIPIHPETRVFPLESINDAIHLLRNGELNGSAVIEVIAGTG
jgi:alcohol dehydrogenase, propanol-preferring